MFKLQQITRNPVSSAVEIWPNYSPTALTADENIFFVKKFISATFLKKLQNFFNEKLIQKQRVLHKTEILSYKWN